MALIAKGRATFTATGGAGIYAVENYPIGFSGGYTLATMPNPIQNVLPILGITVQMDSLASSNGQLELWVPLIGATDFTTIASYTLYNSTTGVWTAINTGSTIAMASYPGALLRFKAGAVNGNPTANYTADG